MCVRDRRAKKIIENPSGGEIGDSNKVAACTHNNNNNNNINDIDDNNKQ